MTKSEKNLCPECGNDVLIADNSRGQIICNNCGVVLKQKCIDSGAEWRAFSEEEYRKRTRTGPKTKQSMYDKGLTTVIGKEDKDASGTKLSPTKRSEFYRLRKWQERTKTAKSLDRNLSFAMCSLNRISSQLNLTKDVKEGAAYYYRKIAKKGLLRGRSIDGMILAAIYVALKENKRIRDFRHFSNISGQDFNLVLKYSKVIQRELKLNLPPTKPLELIPSLCSKLTLSGQVESKAIMLLDGLQKEINLSGRSPSGLASAALYCACLTNNERRSQKEISFAAGITEVTLRKNYKLILDRLSKNIK